MASSTSAFETEPSTGSKTVAAFFDVDNTLVRGASLYLLARKLHERKYFHLREILYFALKQLRFVARGEHLGDIHAIRDRALLLVKGIPVSEIELIGEEIYDEYVEPKLWRGTVSIANQHRAVGREVWLVTATPVEVANVIANRLNLSGALGTVVDREDGSYTGTLATPILHAAEKAQAVRELARQRGISLANSWAYSDSYNDVPLLEAVGHPVCINPDARLRAYAKRRGWQVYDFRKGQRAAKFSLKAAGVIGFLWAAKRQLFGRGQR